MDRGMMRMAVAVGLLALAATAVRAEEPAPAWHGNLALGLTLTRGNSKTVLVNGSALAEKLMKRDEFRFGADVTYGEQEIDDQTETTAQSARSFGDWKHLFTERFYGGLRGEVFHDEVADLDYRVVLGPSVGYYFIKTPTTRLNGDIGAAYVLEKKGGESEGYVTLRLAERGERNMNERWKIWEQAEVLPQVDDLNNFIVQAEVGTEVMLNNKLSLRVIFRDTYVNEPAEGRKANDMTLITAIAYKY